MPSTTTFCDDFDEGAAQSSKWADTPRAGPALFGVDPTQALSRPQSFKVDVPANAPAQSFAYLRYATSGTASHITADLDVFVDALGDADATSLLEIVVNPGAAFYKARLSARRSGLGVQMFDYTRDPKQAQTIPLLASGLPLQEWRHVTFSLELSGDASPSTVDVDLPGLRAPLGKTAIQMTFPRAQADIQVGLNNMTTSGEAWRVWFDNVALTIE
jgi:hypothetical protein